MVKKIMIIIGTVMILAGLSGCTRMQPKASLLDQNWGKSVEAARFSQIENPDAENSLYEDQDLEGTPAHDNYKKYEKGFSGEAPPPQVINVNVGGN